MAERPSTSDGPGARDTGGNQFRFDNKNFSKRISRDDSFLNTKPYAGADFKPYGYPRARLAAPELSPQSTVSGLTVPAIRMPTLEEGGEIGMALGSPGQASSWHTWGSQSAQKMKQAASPGSSKVNGARPSETPAPKKQPGKWKLFGMFGRKHVDQPVSESNEPRGSDPRTGAPQSRPTAKLERSHTTASRKMPKYQPLLVRTSTTPLAEDVAAEHQPKLATDRLEGDRGFRGIPAASDGGVSLAKRGPPPPTKGPVPNGPLLNVEIPTVELERYSVMFSSVLDKPSSSNLLARRQATLQQLRNIDNAKGQEQGSNQAERYRRASSPQPGISPTFEQFPTPPNSQAIHKAYRLSPHSKGGLSRSNTSPAMLHSPLRHRFDSEQPSPSEKQASYNHLRDPIKGNPKGKVTIATLAKNREREQLAASKPRRFDPEVSSLILESPTDSDSIQSEGAERSPILVLPDPLRSHTQQVPEPKWAMINPISSSSSPSPFQQVPSTASSSTSSRKGSPSSSAASAETNTTTPSPQPSSSPPSASDDVVPSPAAASNNDDDDDDEKDEDGIVITKDMSPVEASIARQISISRQQRKLLRPLQTGRSTPRPIREAPSKPGAGVTAASPSKQSPAQLSPPPKMGMAETKSSTPTLVVAGAHLDLQLPQNRKSERIVLEAA